MSAVPALVTLDVWRVPGRAVPGAVAHIALDRRPVRRAPGATFAKLLGTGRGETFGVRDAEPHRWALLACWSDAGAAEAFSRSPVARAWHERCEEHLRVDLRPVSSRGRWSGREPFGQPAPAPVDGPVAVLTRARLRAARAATFYRAVPPVAAALHQSVGLRVAIGIGEAPVGLQGTFSLWDDEAAVRRFAYERPEHRTVVEQTASVGWYAEELFARFAVVRARGRIDGQDLST
ncbi:MAG TPA: monooxygenase [Mycobacteriales bacterium]|nr:monooxygenase [Mycobacteriales bacterium]